MEVRCPRILCSDVLSLHVRTEGMVRGLGIWHLVVEDGAW